MPLASLPELCYNVREQKNKRLRSRHLFFAAIANEPSAIADNERDSAGSRAVAGNRLRQQAKSATARVRERLREPAFRQTARKSGQSVRFASGHGVGIHAGEKGDLLWKKNRITTIPKD